LTFSKNRINDWGQAFDLKTGSIVVVKTPYKLLIVVQLNIQTLKHVDQLFKLRSLLLRLESLQLRYQVLYAFYEFCILFRVEDAQSVASVKSCLRQSGQTGSMLKKQLADRFVVRFQGITVA